MRALAFSLAALALSGCARSVPGRRAEPGVSPSPGQVWIPTEGTRIPDPPVSLPERTEESFDATRRYTLTELIDFALRTSPVTRATWAAARSSEAGLRAERSAYYPTVDLEAVASRAKGSAAGGELSFDQTSYGPDLVLDYLLFDLGGRRASVEEARLALIAKNWEHNAAVQDVVLGVVETYIRYTGYAALLDARRATVRESETNLEAATIRHGAGVATIADVLQAKTALARAQLGLDSVEGEIRSAMGALATAVGVPANTPFDVEPPVDDLPLERVSAGVEQQIREAEENHPDLAAARAVAAKARSHVEKIDSDRWPSLGLSGRAGRVWYGEGDLEQDTYSAALLFRVPVFDGFEQRHREIEARADADVAQARLESLRQLVIYRVWSSYHGLRTAAKQVETAATLVESASQSADVALGRYRAGVGSIVDLLVAQAELSSARAEQVIARSEWLLSLARLARSTGTLWPRPDMLRPEAPRTNDATGGAP